MTEDGEGGKKTESSPPPSPLLPFFSPHLSDGEGVESEGRRDKGRWKVKEGVKEGEESRVDACWSSCVLAVGGRGVVGIGHV